MKKQVKVEVVKAETVNPIEGMKPKPTKAQVIEAMSQIEYSRISDENKKRDEAREKAESAIQGYSEKLFAQCVADGKFRVVSHSNGYYEDEDSFAFVVKFAKDKKYKELKKALDDLPSCEYTDIACIRKEVKARLENTTTFSAEIVKNMVDTPAIRTALAAQLDTLFGRNQPKQLTAGKEADHE